MANLPAGKGVLSREARGLNRNKGLHHCYKMVFGGTASNEQKEAVLDWFKMNSKCYNGYVAARIKPVRYDVTPAERDQRARAELECETTIEGGSSKSSPC